MYTWNWNIIVQYKQVLIHGALVTLWLTLLVVGIGTVLGLALGLMRRSSVQIVAWAAKAYIELFRALPILVLLIWVYYVAPLIIDIRLSPFLSALVALSLNLSAFVAETVRAGIEAIPKHQYESGVALGMRPYQVMRTIILPQAFRNMLPNLMGLYVTQLKNSSLASVIAVNELLHISNTLISNTYRPLEIYSAVAVGYLCLILPFTLLASRLEIVLKRTSKHA
jgi:polar amino acid transport system permease protein